MKKVFVALLVLFLILAVACSQAKKKVDPVDEDVIDQEDKDVIENTKKTTTKKTTTTTAVPTTIKEEVGSRKNPASFGDTMIVSGTLWDGTEFEYSIKISNLVRGEEAASLAKTFNRFNEIPDNQEAIIFDAEFKLERYNQIDDDSYYVSNYDFDYFDSSYTSFRGESIVGSDNEFRGELYEGGQVTGDVIMCIPEGEHGYLLFDDFVWFKLP